VTARSGRQTKVLYVVTEPESVRGAYETWAQCRDAVRGKSGARYMKVRGAEEAEAILFGSGVVLAPGLYAFTDGNTLGGVGVVIVAGGGLEGTEPSVIKEIATSVIFAFRGAGIPALESDVLVVTALRRVRNVLAELAGLYTAVLEVPIGAVVTVVHDYEGVGAFMEEGRWRARDPAVKAVASACRELAHSKSLELTFRHQPGHHSDWAGRHDLARFNARADSLAAEPGADLEPSPGRLPR
jgi:hypothetical protein